MPLRRFERRFTSQQLTRNYLKLDVLLLGIHDRRFRPFSSLPGASGYIDRGDMAHDDKQDPSESHRSLPEAHRSLLRDSGVLERVQPSSGLVARKQNADRRALSGTKSRLEPFTPQARHGSSRSPSDPESGVTGNPPRLSRGKEMESSKLASWNVEGQVEGASARATGEASASAQDLRGRSSKCDEHHK